MRARAVSEGGFPYHRRRESPHRTDSEIKRELRSTDDKSHLGLSGQYPSIPMAFPTSWLKGSRGTFEKRQPIGKQGDRYDVP